VDGRSFFLFEPDQEITRAETVKIVLNTYNFGPTPWQNLYPDVLSTDWFAGFVTTASTFGIVQGYLENGIYYFKPNQLVTRAEALKIVLRTKGITDFSGYTTTFTDVQKGDWYYDYIAFAQAKGIMEGYMEGTQVRPNSYITRAELSKIDLVVEQLL
jgi:N-acetylmuramoyl-L-alanine amidase